MTQNGTFIRIHEGNHSDQMQLSLCYEGAVNDRHWATTTADFEL